MALTDQAFPRLDTQAVDIQTGRWTQPWYRFMISLWSRTGGGAGYDIRAISDQATSAFLSDIMSDQVELPPQNGLVDTGEERFDGPDPIGMLLVSDNEPSDQPVAAVRALTVGASPWTYAARTHGAFLIVGGTVSAVTMARAGATVVVSATAGIVPLSPGDMATVTYTVAPTITFIPR